jgi:hypothetical protein
MSGASARRGGVRFVVVYVAAFCVLVAGGWLVTVGRRGHTASPAASDPYRYLETPGCKPATLPAGQAFPSGEPEPLRPIWCYHLAAMPTTRVSAGNSWTDDFDTQVNMGQLNDGDMGYRVFDDIDNARAGLTSRAFINQNHWMVDAAAGSNGGLLIRPDRSFRFEDGKLVVEADVAAGLPAYGDSASAEIDITTAAAPTGHVVDAQYGYGQFGGNWTFGCRFQADRQMTCSLFDASGAPGDPSVFGNELGRVWQMLPFQHVGVVNFGGQPTGETNAFFRECGTNRMDLQCRDRFRLELTKDSVRVFVNGHLYFEQSGIDPKYQLPPEFLNSDVYTYFTSWVNRPLQAAYRFHWDRLAINPTGPAGDPLPPSAAPSFGLTVPAVRQPA